MMRISRRAILRGLLLAGAEAVVGFRPANPATVNLAGFVREPGRGWWDFITGDLAALGEIEIGYLAIYEGGLDAGWVEDFRLSLADKFPGPVETWLPLIFR